MHELIVMLLAVEQGKQKSGHYAALYCQSPVPDLNDPDRISQIIVQIRKQNIPDPGTQDAEEHGSHEQVIHDVRVISCLLYFTGTYEISQ